MKKYAAAIGAYGLLASSAAFASQEPRNTSAVSSTDPVTGERRVIISTTDPVTGKMTTRAATAAESARIRASLQSLHGLEESLASLKGLGSSLAGLENSLKGLDGKIARLERMVETETPVSTTTTEEGLVRVYRDGTTVIDKEDGSRTFQQRD